MYNNLIHVIINYKKKKKIQNCIKYIVVFENIIEKKNKENDNVSRNKTKNYSF